MVNLNTFEAKIVIKKRTFEGELTAGQTFCSLLVLFRIRLLICYGLGRVNVLCLRLEQFLRRNRIIS